MFFQRLLLALAVVILASPAWANDTLVAEIPFGFDAGNQSYPAGIYRIVRTVNPVHLCIEPQAGPLPRISLMTLPTETANNANGALVFHRYGNMNFLMKAKFLDFNLEIPDSKREKTLVTSKLVTANRPTLIVIPASLR
jgi:hypothetical protein